MECKICFNAYNDMNPPILLNCGHTLCSICLSSLRSKKCPFDRNQIKGSTLNISLISLIRKTSKFSLFTNTLNQVKLSDTCPLNHGLSLTEIHNSVKTKCNNCNQFVTTSTWHCSECNYDICHLCKGEVLCSDGHLMSGLSASRFKCDGCLRVLDETSRSCGVCDVDLCEMCCKKYLDKSARREFCCNGHEIKWRPKIINVCMMEGKKFEKTR